MYFIKNYIKLNIYQLNLAYNICKWKSSRNFKYQIIYILKYFSFKSRFSNNSRTKKEIQLKIKKKFFQACGGHLIATETEKYFYSHAKFGNQDYDHYMDCDWNIEAPVGKNIRLQFMSFDLEDQVECSCDYVEVFAGYDSSSPTYGKFCGNPVSIF